MATKSFPVILGWSFKFLPRFDVAIEKDPCLIFRANASLLSRPVFWAPKDTQNTVQLTLNWPVVKETKAKQQPIVFFADLFAQTEGSLDKVQLPCRRFLATAIWTWEDVIQKRTIESTDMVPGHVKFSLSFDTSDAPTLSVPEQASAQAEQVHQRLLALDWTETKRLLKRMYDLCLASNKTFQSGTWLMNDLRTYNTSYIDSIFSPLSPAMRPIPGWLDLGHLTLARPTRATFYVHSLVQACQRMQIKPEEFFQSVAALTSPDQKVPLLAVEVVCDAAAWLARRSIYVHDTVDVTPVDTKETSKKGFERMIQEVDHYGFPRLVDRPDMAGDDCESLSKETLLWILDVLRMPPPSLEQDPDGWIQAAQSILQCYVWYQVTGGIRTGNIPRKRGDRKQAEPDNPDTLQSKLHTGSPVGIRSESIKRPNSSGLDQTICHSWILGVPVATNDLWIRRGRQFIVQMKKGTCSPKELKEPQDKDWPVLMIESTEYTTATPWKYGSTLEKTKSKFCESIQSCPAAEAFRIKIPYSTVEQVDRYQYLISAVCWTGWQTYSSLEFMFGTMNFEKCTLQRGIRVKHALSAKERQADATMALFPVHSLQMPDLRDGLSVLDWFPPIHEIPFTQTPTKCKTSMHDSHSIQLLHLRPMDWTMAKPHLERWCADNGWVIHSVQECTDFDACQTIRVELTQVS